MVAQLLCQTTKMALGTAPILKMFPTTTSSLHPKLNIIRLHTSSNITRINSTLRLTVETCRISNLSNSKLLRRFHPTSPSLPHLRPTQLGTRRLRMAMAIINTTQCLAYRHRTSSSGHRARQVLRVAITQRQARRRIRF